MCLASLTDRFVVQMYQWFESTQSPKLKQKDTMLKVDLKDAVTKQQVRLYNDSEEYIVKPDSWKWINSFSILCEFTFKNQRFAVVGEADSKSINI